MLTDSFPEFRPKLLIRSGHAQTLAAFVLRGRQRDHSANAQTVDLFDGDRLVVHDDEPDNWITGDRIVIIMHGLCGCHGSPYMVRTADKLNRMGYRTIRVDMRGFGDSTFISKSHLHGGCSQDLLSVIGYAQKASPLSPISLVGFSIGGNIVLRTLGKWKDKIESIVDSAIAVCPPVDLVTCSGNLRNRGNRFYEKYFVHRMSAQLALRRRQVKGMIDTSATAVPRRLIHFDDQVTAPCWGYKGAVDYYQDASSGPWLASINVPTVILTAKDDPVVPFSMFSQFPLSSDIELVATSHGGHIGFLAGETKDPDRHWMDWRICQAITNRQRAIDLAKQSRSTGRQPHSTVDRERKFSYR
jgi:predicted alpha/beta-fold hydrolase